MIIHHGLSISYIRLLTEWRTHFIMFPVVVYIFTLFYLARTRLPYPSHRVLSVHGNTNVKTYLVFGRPTLVTPYGRRSLARRRLCVDQLRLVAVVYGEHVWVAVMVPRPPRIRGTVCGQPLVQIVQILVARNAAPHARGQQVWWAPSAAWGLLKNGNIRLPFEFWLLVREFGTNFV